ncbi:hypothetical protein [Fundidesulfovibrio putealis]|uniref:hypothetical protein n=1 Tax=Fundidesulfovibrio putealis TaxID=270496 RepID=UPI0004121EC3|nr:hypothetical protein [Fundidesulfovibrio putealis]
MTGCYEITNAMAFQTPEEKRICRAIHRMFYSDAEPVGEMLLGIRGTGMSTQNASAMLRFISTRTLAFNKPFERLTLKEAAAGCRFSSRTAQNAFDWLVAQGYLFKMCRQDDGSECYYGLNLKKIHEGVRPIIDKLNHKTNAWRDLADLHGLAAGPVFDRMCAYTASFANRLIHGLRSFITKAQEAYRTIMNDLMSMLTSAKAKSQETAKAKSAKKAEEPLFTQNGKANGKVGLETWYKAVADKEYEGCVRNMAGKMRGLMGYYVTELRNDGYDDEAIHLTLANIVAKWRWIPSALNRLQVTTKNCKTFRVSIPKDPDFEFFFTHRKDMTPVLRSVYNTCLPRMNEMNEDL